MNKIFINHDYKCHTKNDGSMSSVETDFFDGKCAAFIEGYRLIPSGKSMTTEDGKTIHGETIAPWKDHRQLAAAQAQYELDMAEAEAAYQEGVNSV